MSDAPNTKGHHPSLVGGHAQYVKGLGEAGVAAVTGNSAWQRSADADKSQGINTMKAASAARDPQQQGMGKVEELAGKAVGCEGMQQEGAESAAATTNTNTTQKKTGEGHTYYSRGENVEI
ncbi:uncharacterized protein SEPMUDRAFT_146340 [Sphaerulina musiva SO2202]|uniref:CsbD-like domain-containing protein n=1 Tax=Sphaerulina musiva (strain SO2202) TaxID=692275 RepID=N1QJ98_SPHMS|nr:uncharacterized protein SEPMUDRAFT_146340 [Sphaerulina musiva SO2202]EMF17265.1 hypothetical protein SEPMUDRAFT_146340 [Sphaerulina musiva SO2202]